MKMRMKRIMGLFLALVMSIGCLSLNPIASYANDTNEKTFNINAGNVNITKSGTYTIEGTGQPTSNTISVTGSNIRATITLKNVNIDVSAQSEQKAFYAKSYNQSNVHLTIILKGTNSLKSSENWAGLTWNNSDNSSTLEIKGNGSLTAKCWRHGAGIGSSWNNNGTRNISITGGTVTATGGDGAAGIGGGESGLGENITISGGTVTATGGYQAAGIGGGNHGSGENIKISGGTVTATGGTFGAGIGGGEGGSGKNIKITGGTVTATGGALAAGIGGCRWGSGENITITGGTVTATGGGGAAGIGGGDAGSGRNITITGGTVKASSISTTPTDGKGNNVYLAKLENQDGVNTVDSGTGNAKTFTRAGNHPGNDTAFYLYLTGQDHDLVTSKGKYKAKWNSTTNGFTIRPEHGVVHIDADNFPNEHFRSYVKQFDGDHDGWLSKKELEKVEKISIENQSVSNLKGIEYFKNLKELDCSNNELRSLDVSRNTKLEVLDCSNNNNKLRSLDVSNNPKLTKLDCNNNYLTSLDLRNNTELTELDCSGNKLNSLNLSNNPKLTKLDCNNNYLTSLDLRNNTELIELDCNNNWLTSLDSSNNKDLTSLNCSNNDLPSLDLSNNTKLSNLNCGNQQYNIVLNGTKEFKYSNFPGKFDKEKVKSLVGASLGDDALIVNDDNPREVTYKYKFSNSVEMNVKLTVGYMEFDPEHIASAKVITQPTLSYAEGDRLDLTGLVVTLKDNSDVTIDVPFAELGRYNITATPANGTFLTVVDHNCKHVKLTFSIPGLPVKFYLGQTGILIVKKFDPTHVTSMTVKHQPSKLKYTEGENLDLTGLEVTLEDANHVKKVVTPAQFEANGIKATPENGAKLALTDGNPVKLTRGNLTATTSALKVKAKESIPTHVGGGSTSTSGSGSAGGSAGGFSAGMNYYAPTTVDKDELNIQIDSAESDYKHGNAGDGAGAAVKQVAAELDDVLVQAKRVATNPNATQAQVGASARKLADARKAQHEKPDPKPHHEKPDSKSHHEKQAPKSQTKKRIGMIHKTDKSASFAGLIAVLVGSIAVIGFSIAGFAILRRRK